MHIDTDRAAREWIEAHFKEWHDQLTAKEIDALETYKGNGYAEINAALRGLGPSDAHGRNLVRALDSALSSYRLDQAVIVYRAFCVPEIADLFDIEDLDGTDEYQDPAFASTSLLRSVAETFALNEDDPDLRIIGQIHLPGGIHAISVGSPEVIKDLNEAEILLPRATTLRILETSEPNDHQRFRTLKMEALNDHEGTAKQNS